MAGYIGVTFGADDPDDLTASALDEMAVRFPGFDSKEAHLEVSLLEITSRLNAETRSLASLVPDSIFRYYGESLVNVLPVTEAFADVSTTWTMTDPSGYTIEDGTVAAFRIAGDQLVSFRVVGDYIVPPTSLSLSGVTMRALDPGTAPNGLGPEAMELVDALAFVAGVQADSTSSGGVQAETDDAYLGRLRDEMTLLTPRFVLATDAAVLARRIPGVYRALGIDNYNPETQTHGNEKTISVAVVDESGSALTPSVKDQVRVFLNGMREINFLIYIVDPSYTTVNVNFSVVAHLGYDLADLRLRCISALTSYLSASTWGGGGETPPVWRGDDNVVRYLEVAEALNAVEGVHYIASLLLNGGSANVPLAGVAPLPIVGTLDGTAVNA